jgi:hypothetical protein
MTVTSLTNGIQTVTGTGPTASADVSGVPPQSYRLKIHVLRFSTTDGSQPGARIVIEESANGFSTAVPVAVLDVPGQVNSESVATFLAYNIPLSKVGIAGASMRANLVYFYGFGASLKFEAFLESF